MRNLTLEEINILKHNRCSAEDWKQICVSKGFKAEHVSDTRFFGKCEIGETGGIVKNCAGFLQPAEIRNARIANSSIGDNCIIENISGCINNASIGNGCTISNVSSIRTTGETHYGLFRKIAILNEAGEGNIMYCPHLTAQTAALMAIPNIISQKAKSGLYALAKKDIEEYFASEKTSVSFSEKLKTTICDNVIISNTQEITNSYISTGTTIHGTRCINECAFFATPDAPVFIGNGTILNGCTVTFGSRITDNVIAHNCFVGEYSTLADGFSATDSVFFANSFMANGEACAAFCGPFTVSHHKSTLLIGGLYSFYNAGSSTNFSNHAYKMGPIHWGIMERGSKTASSAHILWPAHTGYFSMCMGKVATHPDTTRFPFSYIIGDGRTTWLVPARNIATVGTFRDINKWPKRDIRPDKCKFSTACTNWLHPGIAVQVLEGKHILEKIAENQKGADRYSTEYGCNIKHSALEKGIALYELYLQMYISENLQAQHCDALLSDTDIALALKSYEEKPNRYIFHDLAGATISEETIESIEKALDRSNVTFENISDLLAGKVYSNADALSNEYILAVYIAEKCYGISTLPIAERHKIIESCAAAKQHWLKLIKEDAEKEYAMGDVDKVTLEEFLRSMQQ